MLRGPGILNGPVLPSLCPLPADLPHLIFLAWPDSHQN